MTVYGARFFEEHQPGARRSAAEIVPLVLKLIRPRQVIDVGCGLGTWLSVFVEHGITDVWGVDGAYLEKDKLLIPAQRFLPFDLEKPLRMERSFDLVISLEVAEHLAVRCADTFVDSVTRLGPVVLFSAAIPYQGGTNHLNEQWPDYWADRFRERGYVVADPIRRKIWRNPNVEWWYAQNILMFVREERLHEYPALKREVESTHRSQLSLVHPRKYLGSVPWSHRLERPLQDTASHVRLGRSPLDAESALEKVQPYTMVRAESLLELGRQVRAVLGEKIPGDLVECGVWRGGASFLMADLLRQAGARDRRVWLFDSFEGIQSPLEIDGEAALAWARNTDGPRYFDNMRVSENEVRSAADRLGLATYVQVVKGWFEQTLPAHREAVGPIALLRIDCDWHASVRCCLESLYDKVATGGFIIFDDYFTFEGCRVAVHEFLGERRLPHPIESPLGAASGMPALFRKGPATWQQAPEALSWSERAGKAARDIEAAVPPGHSYILIDEDTLGIGNLGGRRAVPFLERSGQYWGPPSDGETAVREFERLRRAGATFAVICWPAFWWLEHYPGWREHLRSRFPCVLENDRVVAFELSGTRTGGDGAGNFRAD